ncbi:MAG: alkaline phosphatase family protein [Planctomycetota bacterium]
MTRTLLIGLDGATFTILDPLMNGGVMPCLARLVKEGVRAELRSTPNPVTPPAWTTVMTGRSPGQHGIFDFIRAENVIENHVVFRLTNGLDIRCETIWSIVGRNGKTSGTLNFPNAYQVPSFNGYLVPGFVTSRFLRTSTHPRSFWDRIKQLPDFDVKDAAWDLDEGRKPLGRGLEDVKDFMEWIDYLKRKERGWCAVTKTLLTETPCDLVAVIFEGVDRLQHQAWNFLDPACEKKLLSDVERRLKDNSIDYFRQLDGMINELVQAAGSDARTLIVSDHGFGPTSEVFYANVWLEKLGYLTWKASADSDSDGMLTAHNMRDHFATIDWSKTIAYARTTSANGIYIRVATKPGQVGVNPKEYSSVRSKIASELLAYRDPATNTPVVTGVMTREQAFPGQAMEDAPDLTVTLRDSGFISILRSPHVVKARPDVKGTHRPEGVLIAHGLGFRRGTTVDMQSILDVAPTCLHSLDIPIPSDLEGRVMTDLYDPAFLRAQPVRTGPQTVDPKCAATDATLSESQGLDAESEATVLERLKALGYME